MASVDDVDALNAALGMVDNLEESLLPALELTHLGYSADLRFTHPRRGEPGPEASLVTVVRKAVSALCLTGALSEAMGFLAARRPPSASASECVAMRVASVRATPWWVCG